MAAQVAYCQPLDSDTKGSTGDQAPPSWQLSLVNTSLQAQLLRTPRQNGTLAALDDPFACNVTASPATLRATAVPLATALPPQGSDAADTYTAYLCGGTDDTGNFGLSTNAAGAVYATFAANAPVPTCHYAAPQLLRRIQGTEVLLQQAPTPTVPALFRDALNDTLTDATTLNATYQVGNLSVPSAAMAALCAPFIASAVANYNYSAPLASLQTTLEQNTQNKLFAALGPVGGSVVLALIGGVAAATAGGVATVLSRRHAAQAGPSAATQAADPSTDLHAIPLTPTDPATPSASASDKTAYGRISTSGYAPLGLDYYHR